MCQESIQNDEKDVFDRKLTRLREKQSRCEHPSLKCSLCELYKDKLDSKERNKIKELNKIIKEYEKKTNITKKEIML